MDRLPGVLLEMEADQPDAAALVPRLDRDRPTDRQRRLVLGDLVSLRQVRVEVVLPRELAPLLDLAAERQRPADRQLDDSRVENRQRTRMAEADRASLRVGRRTEVRRAAAEDLRPRAKLRVDLEPDDGLVFLHAGESLPALIHEDVLSEDLSVLVERDFRGSSGKRAGRSSPVRPLERLRIRELLAVAEGEGQRASPEETPGSSALSGPRTTRCLILPSTGTSVSVFLTV